MRHAALESSRLLSRHLLPILTIRLGCVALHGEIARGLADAESPPRLLEGDGQQGLPIGRDEIARRPAQTRALAHAGDDRQLGMLALRLLDSEHHDEQETSAFRELAREREERQLAHEVAAVAGEHMIEI